MYGVCGVCVRMCVTTVVISPDEWMCHVPLHTQGTGVWVCVVVCVVVFCVGLYVRCECVVCVCARVCLTTVMISPDGCVCHVLLHSQGTQDIGGLQAGTGACRSTRHGNLLQRNYSKGVGEGIFVSMCVCM